MNLKLVVALVGAAATLIAAVVPALISTLRTPPAVAPASVTMQGNTNIYAPGGTVHAPTNVFNFYAEAWMDGVSVLRGRPREMSGGNAVPPERKGPAAPAPSPATEPQNAPDQSRLQHIGSPPPSTDSTSNATVSRVAPPATERVVNKVLVIPTGPPGPLADVPPVAEGQAPVSASAAARPCTNAELQVTIEQSPELAGNARNELKATFEFTPGLCGNMRYIVRMLASKKSGGRKLEPDKPLDRVAAQKELEAARADPAMHAALVAAVGKETGELRVKLIEAAVLHDNGLYMARDLLVASIREWKRPG